MGLITGSFDPLEDPDPKGRSQSSILFFNYGGIIIPPITHPKDPSGLWGPHLNPFTFNSVSGSALGDGFFLPFGPPSGAPLKRS
jgi:hypothetical protein